MQSETLFYIGSVSLVFGSLGLWINSSIYQGALMDSSSFAQTRGQIVVSYLDFHRRRKRGIPFGKETAYSYDIRYRYQIGGQTYNSQRVDFILPRSSTDSESVRPYLRKYPVGKTVNVFYSRKQPEFSVLEPNHKGHTLVTLGVVLGAWSSGLLIVVSHCIRRLQSRWRARVAFSLPR